MAFNYENPHDDPNLGNYDYYVNEVKDFQRKLDEYQESVDQKLADQDSEIADFKLNVNNQIGTLRNQLADFEGRITDEVDSINEHTETYVNNYLTENINTILEDNPVLDTIYQKVGVVAPNSTITVDTPTSDIIDIVILTNQMTNIRYLGNNTYHQAVSATPRYTDVTIDGETYTISIVPPIQRQISVTSGTTTTIENLSSENLTVYKKRFN